MKKKDFLSLKLKEISIFQTVGKLGSLRESSRILNLAPSEVSKCLSAMEETLGTNLFKRTTSGMVLTEAGLEFLEIANNILSETQKIELIFSENFDGEKNIALTIAATTFLINVLVAPEIMKWRFENNYEKNIVRFIDLSPDDLLVAASSKAFELAVHMNELKLPQTWYSKKIGNIEWGLWARHDNPIFSEPSFLSSGFVTIDEILHYKFVVPAYYDKLGLHTATDNFSMPLSRRQIGATTSTAESALHCILHSNMISHLPNLLTKQLQREGKIKKINILNLEDVSMPLFLSVLAEKVSKQVFQKVSEILGTQLS